MTLPPDLAEAGRAREFVGRVATEAGFAEQRTFEIQVSCSEAVANAIEHAPVKGQVRVTTLLYHDRLEVQVEGPGEFQTPDRLKDPKRSRGLGLPLMARLSDHLALYSTAHGGTLVGLTFYLPQARQPDAQEPLPPSIRELIESSELVRGITDLSSDAILVLPPDGPIEYWNSGAERLYGYAREEAVGREGHHLLQTVFPVAAGGVRQALERDGEWIGELVQTAKDGRRVTVEARWQRVELAGRTLILETNRDITGRLEAEKERLRLLEAEQVPNEELRTANEELMEQTEELMEREEALRESEEKHRTLFENAYEATAVYRDVLDERGEVVDFVFDEVNQAAEALTGMNRSALVGEKFGSVFGRFLLECHLPAVREMRSRGRPAVYEDPVDGAKPIGRYFNTSYVPLDATRFIASIRDVTAQVVGEAERARLAAANADAVVSLQRELARTELLSDVAAVLARSLSVGDIAQSVLEAIAAKLRPHLASFYIITPDGRSLEHIGYLGYPVEALPGLALIPMSESIVGYALSRRLPYVTHDTAPQSPTGGNRAAAVGARGDRWIVLPLQVGGQLLGGMVLTFPGLRPFRHDEVTLFQTISSLVAVALRNARLYEEQRGIAENLQRALLSIPEQVGRLRLGHLYRSATEAARVGGDFYDVFEVKDGKIAVLIGDVSGHGIRAARTATLVKDVVHAFTHQSPATDRVFEWTNDLLVEKELPGFVTLFLGILDGSTGELSYSSAGHPQILVLRGGEEVEALRSGTSPLGIYPRASWKQYSAELETGDILLLYTDGIIEARHNGELYGEDRLAGLLREGRVSVERLPHLILDKVLAFSGGTLTDDAAVLALTLGEEDRASRTRRRFRQEKLLKG
jgi:PAS domain S-box-containing protein